MNPGADKKPKRVRAKVPPDDARQLLFDSRGFCGKPECENPLTRRTAKSGALVTIHEAAHIIAASDNGPRGDPLFPPEKRERYDNLILMCDPCHKEIDHKENHAVYPKELLREWKATQQRLREEADRRLTTPHAYEELNTLLSELAEAEVVVSDGFDRIKLADKIYLNDLDANVSARVTRAIYNAPQVEQALNQGDDRDIDFSQNVVATLKRLYLDIKKLESNASNIYHLMAISLTKEGDRFVSESVVELVLSYFFERCIIFEKAES